MSEKFHVFAGSFPCGGMSDYKGLLEVDDIRKELEDNEWGDIASIDDDGDLVKVAWWDEDKDVSLFAGGWDTTLEQL